MQPIENNSAIQLDLIEAYNNYRIVVESFLNKKKYIVSLTSIIEITKGLENLQ